MIPPERFDSFPPDWGMLRRSRCVQIFLQTPVGVSSRHDPVTLYVALLLIIPHYYYWLRNNAVEPQQEEFSFKPRFSGKCFDAISCRPCGVLGRFRCVVGVYIIHDDNVF